jgi:ketosteroid isomerase-like protein
MSRLLAEDAVFLIPGSDLVQGPAQITERWTRYMAEIGRSKLTGERSAEVNPSGTLALVVHAVKDPSGKNVPAFQVAWRRDPNSGWRVVLGWSCPDCNCAAKNVPAPAGDEVWRAESSFAKTMADRDHAAFERHLAPDALFFGQSGPLRGRAEVARAWSRFYEGPKAPFAWGPERSVLLKSGSLALTYGPVWAPDGRRTATFSSVWRKERDGTWRVVLDRSCRACDCSGK